MKNLKKKVFWLLAVVAIVVSAFAVTAFASESAPEDLNNENVSLEDGYVALPDLDGNPVVGKKPTATVKNLGSITVPAADYGVWDGSSYDGTADTDMPLSVVMQFLADQTEADMATSPYADWYGDFVITFSGIEGGSFFANGCYLAGFYGDFGWVKVPVDGLKIENNVRYPVMLGVGLGQKYDYICSGVQDFKCALYLTPEILAANPDIEVTLELALVDNSKGSDAAADALVKNTNIYTVVAKDYAALPDLNGNYIFGEKPTATVNNFGITTVPAGKYGVWNGSSYTSTSTEDMPLSFVMQFLADQDAEDMETSPYADWYGDFVITFSGIKDGSFIADGCYLAGFYGDFGWVKVPVDEMKIENNVRYPVMLGVGLGQKYDYICSGVQDFKCALYLTPEILAANPDIKVNLELALVDNSKGSDEAAKALMDNKNVYKVVDYTYEAKDFVVPDVIVEGTKVTVSEKSENSYDIVLEEGETFPEAGVTMTFPATGDTNGMAYVVHEHVVEDATYTYIYVGKVSDDKLSFKNTVGFSTFTINNGGLAEALAAAQDGDTIVLLADIEIVGETFTIPADKSITLDMNGKKITATDNKAANVHYELFYIYGELTVTGNGTIELTSTSNDTAYAKSSTIFHNRGGVLTIENGTFKHLGGTAMAYVVDNSANSFGDAYLYVKGGEIISENYIAIRMRMEDPNANGNPGNGLSIAEVTGGYIYGANRGIWGQKSSGANAEQGQLTVTGGVVENNRTDRGAIQIDTDSYEAQNMLVSISGDATIKGAIMGGDDEFAVSGGIFTVAVPEKYCADGFVCEQNADGTYGIAVDPTYGKVAKVGNTYYTDLQEAIKAAAPSGTVELLCDVTVEKWIMISETLTIGDGTVITLDMDGLTIDGNGHTLTINDIESANNGNHLFFDGDYNICDLTLVMANNVNGVGITSGTISNVTFIGGRSTSGGSAIQVSDGLIYGAHAGNVTIEGCTFKNNGGAIYFETAQNGLVVNNNTFEINSGANVILMRGTETFTNNTVVSGRTVNVVSGSPVVTGNNFGDVRLKVYNAATATVENNVINNLAFNDETIAKSTFDNNTLSESAQEALDAVTAPPVIVARNQAELQAALDNFKSGTTIELVAGVNYGTVYLRPNPSNPATKEIDWVGNNYVYESYTCFEGLTIKGAEGAIIDVIKIEGGTYYNTEHSQAATYPVMLSLIELKNVTIEGVTFTGNGGWYGDAHGNAISMAGCNIKVDGLTLKNCVLQDSTNNNRLLYKSEATGNHTYTYGGETYTFVADQKNITVTGCTFNGGYMGMELRETENVTITNNTFNGVSSRDILLTPNSGCTFSGKIIISGNTSNGAGNRFVRATGIGNAELIIKDNTIKNYAGPDADFIKADGVTGNVTIANNTFDGEVIVAVSENGTYKLMAPTYVASVNGVKYTDLQSAIDAAGEGDTIILLDDVALTAPLNIAADKNVTLDLNGKTLSYTSETAGEAMILNRGTLTLKNGNVAFTFAGAADSGKAANAVCNYGSLTINGANISNTTAVSNQIGYAVDNYSGATLTVKSGSVNASGSYYYDSVRLFCNSETAPATVVVEGGTVGSIWMQNPSDSNGAHTKDFAGSVTISGGTVAALYLEPSTKFAASITGGHVNKVAYHQTEEGRNVTGFISGGTFSSDVSAFCAEGFVCEQNADGTYGIVVDPAYGKVAKIGDTYYATFAEALAAAQDGDTIVLLANVEFDGDDLYVDMVLDLNGKTITATGTYVFWFEGGSLTVMDSSAEKTGMIDGSATVSNAFLLMGNESLTIESGKIHANNNVIYAAGSGATVTVNGGELKSYIATGNIFYLVGANDTITVNGGTFIGNVNPYASGLTICGGLFTADVNAYCAANRGAVKNGNGMYEIIEINASNAAAQIGDKYYLTLGAAINAAGDNDTIYVLKDVTENLPTLRGKILPANGNVTITATNSDWLYCPYTFIIGEGVTLNVPALYYYAGGAVINGTVVAGAYYQSYAGTKLTINEPGSMTVTSETCIIRYMEGDPNAGIYIVGDNDDSTVGLKLSVAYFYQGMINAKDANIQVGTYWQTQETDGQGSANLVLDNSKLTVTVYDHPAEATGNSTVTLKNGSVMNCSNGGVAFGDNATVSIDATSKILGKNGEEVKIGLQGSGTSEDPFLINNIDDLKLFRDMVNSGTTFDNQFVKLTADIDLGGEAWTPIGNSANKFLGTFDGGEFTVSNLVVNVNTNNAGLFGFASVIKNLKLVNAKVTGLVSVGAIVGELESSVGTVENCHVSGLIQITGENSVGGLAGKGYANIKNCSVIGDGVETSFVLGVYGSTEEGDNVGGLIGHLGEGNTLGVANSTVKYIKVLGTRKVGGLVGTTARGNDYVGNTVDNVTVECTATAEYANENAATTTIGGIIGNYFGSATSGGILKDSTVTNVTFVLGNAKSAGALVGGDRNNNGGAPVGVEATGSTVTNVTGATQNYLLPAVAKIGDVTYATLADALAAAATMTGDVTVEIFDKVTLASPINGSFESITFVGKNDVAEIYIDLQGAIYATGKNVTFKGLKLSKVAGGYVADAGFMNLAFGIYGATKVTYTNCTFVNGAYASYGENIFTGCTFYRSHDRYGMWAYGAESVVVDGCTFADIRGIKMYDEGKAGTTNLTVKNTDFSEADNKPAIVLTYGNSVTLENNTYSAAGVFELDLDGNPNGVAVNSDVLPTCKNDNGACGVIVDGKIYTTVAQAAAVATKGSKVTLLHNSAETVELAEGVILDKNGFEAAGVTVKAPKYAAKIGNAYFVSVAEALEYAYNNNMKDIEVTLLGETKADTTDSVDLYNKYGNGTAFNTITFKQEDSSKAYYLESLYTGWTTGGVVFDGVNIVVTSQLFAIGNFELINNSSIKRTNDAKNFVFYGTMIIEAGSTFESQVDGISSGSSMTVDGGTYKTVFLTVEAGNTFIVKNGANVLITNYETSGDLTLNGVLELDLSSSVSAVRIVGNGKIVVDATGFTGSELQVLKNLSGFTGTIELVNANNVDYKLENGVLYLVDPAYGKVAVIGDTYYATLADALAAAKSGDEIVLLADVAEDVTVPAGVIFNGNGKQVGVITAAGEITFKGHTKATNFGTQYTNTTINIIEGACLEITGTGRMVIGHGCTFNITGNITDAKTADKANIQPSLIVAAGASFTGKNLTFNVNNAYVKFNGNSTSKNSNANGTFNFNVTNSIWEQTGVLAFYVPTSGMDPTFNLTLKNSVLTTTSHLVFSVTKGEIVFDNSNVNVGTSRQIENRSTMTIKNGSVVNGAVATSSNAINPGTIIVENATYAVTGQFSGAAEGIGTLILKKGANVSVGSIVDKANIQIDATGMTADDVVNFTGNLSKFTGTVEVINNDKLEAKIVDGKIVLSAKPVAQIGDVKYATLAEAIAALKDGDILTILAGEISEGTIKFPASLKNVTIKGAANNASILKDMTLMACDGSNITYEGITFDGIVFDNSNILFSGQRASASFKDWTITNCTFKNVARGNAAISFNLKTTEAMENFTFTNNVIDGVTGGNYSGLVLRASKGNIVVTGNDIKNVAWNAIQLINSTADTLTVTGNSFASGADEGILNLYGVTATALTIKNNKFLVTEGQPGVCYITAADVSKNYWGGNAPANLPEGVVYTSYYKDAALTELVEISYVAEINGTKYETLADALAAAKSGDTITLLAPIVVAKDETLDLDLGGATLAFSTDATAAMILNKGTLTLSNGTVAYTYTGVATTSFAANAISNLGTLTINGVNVSNTTTSNGQIGYAIDNYGSLTIKSGKITATGSNYYDGIRMFCNSETVEVSVTVKGGEISSIWMQNPSDGNGGNNTKDVLGSLTISGGNVNNVWLEPSSKFEASITGGIIGKVAYNQTAEGRDLTGFISGGTFRTPVAEEYCAEGYIPTANNDGTYGVKVGKFVAQIGDKKYETLDAAIAAAQTGDTIALLADVTLNGKLTVTKAITIDGDDHSIIANHTAFILEVQANATFKNLTLDTNNKAKGVKIASGNVVFDNITIPNSNKSDAITVSAGASLTVKTYLKVASSYTLVDARGGPITAEPGTVFDIANWRANASPATCDLKGAVDVNGNSYFAAYDSTTYYKTFSKTSASNLTLLKDIELTGNLTVSGTLNLNGHNLTFAEGKKLNINANTTIVNGTLACEIVLAVGKTLTAAEGLNVTTADGYKVVYENGVYTSVERVYVAEINGTKYETLADAVADIATDGSDTTIKLLCDIELSSYITFKYGTGKIIFTADTPVTIKQMKTGTDFDFVEAIATNVVFEKNVTFQIYDNQSGVYLYYGPSLTVNGAIIGGQNWGCIYLFNGEHVVNKGGLINVGRVQVAFTTVNAYGEIKTNYLLVEGATFNATGAIVNAGVIYDSNNGGMRWGASKFNFLNGTTVTAGSINLQYDTSTLTIDLSSSITANKVVGEGTIYIDARAFTGQPIQVITADMSGFTGNIEIIGNDDVIYEITEEGLVIKIKPVAQIGEQGYATLAEALAAAQSGDEIVLLADVANAGAISLKAGVTLNGNGRTISGNSCVYMAASGETAVKNVNFKNIHNDSDNLSAIYANGLTSDAKITITGCTFENIDWDSIQITSKDDSKPTVAITGNTFLTDTDTTVLQYRHVHMELGATTRSKIDFTLKNNKFYGKVSMSPLALYYIDPDGSTLNIDKNYIEFTDRVSVVLSPAGASSYNANELILPLYDENLTNKLSFEAVVVTNKYNAKICATIADAIAAAKDGDVVTILPGEYAPIDISNKNITIQGTLGANGEYLTVIKGGNPAITGHGFNGTIKDLKIVDAFKVMYAEPAGNVTVDNVYVTGATYGFHLVAYSTGLTWTIQNSYMDLSWANSFGVYGSGDAAIVIKGNVFESTAPYYPDYGALPVNTFLPNVTVEENVFGENTKIKLSDASKASISKNYHADGVQNAFAGDSKKAYISSYYVDEELTTLKNLLKGFGTEADPYIINNVEDLILFRNSVNAGETIYSAPGVYVALAADIDLAGINWVGIGSATAEHGFMGNFDGKGFKIKNLTITNPALDSDGYAYAGLFGVTEGTDKDNQNTIKNLIIENVTIKTTGHIVAAAIAYPYYTIVDNVTVCGDIKIEGGNYTAGALAYTRRCVNASNVTVSGNAGSFITGKQVVGGVISDIQMNGGLTANYSNFAASGLKITGEKMVGGISGIIATQNLNGATVKNVTLVSGDSRVGIVAGSFGGTTTITNVVYENVNGATAIIGSTYDNGAAVQAKIGDTYYATLADALAAVQVGDTITLLADVTLTETLVVEAGKTVTLDLNGKTISGSSSESTSYAMLTNNGNLTIKDSVGEGKISYNYTGASSNYSFAWGNYTILNSGKLTVESGTIENTTNLTGHMFSAIDNHSGGVVTINGGTISCPNYVTIRQFASSATADNTVVINGGTVSGKFALWPQNANGNADTKAILTLNGGIIEGSSNALYIGGPLADTFTITKSASLDLAAPADHKWVEQDGKYVLAACVYVAEINGTKYETLADALATAQAGETVKLLADVTLDAVIVIEKAITLDLDGHTVTGANKAVVFQIKADTTIVNGKIAGNKTGTSSGLLEIYANLNMNGVTVETSSIKAMAFKAGGFTAVLTDCTVTGGLKGYGASVWQIYGGTYYVGSSASSEHLNGTVEVYSGTFHYELLSKDCAPGYEVVDNGDGTWTVAYNPACFVDTNNNGVLDDGEAIYGSLDEIFETIRSGDVYIVLLRDVEIEKQVDTNVNAKYYLNAAEGVTVTFKHESGVLSGDVAASEQAWNFIQNMYIGENVTLNAKYMLLWGDVEIAGTVNTTYLYTLGATVDVLSTGKVNVNSGEATVQVKTNTTFTVDGELNTTLLQVWTENAKLIINGTVNARTISAWDENPTIIVADNATVNAKFNLSDNASVEGPAGLDVTTGVADHKIAYENGVYSVVECTYIAQVGDTKYESLAEAIDAANGNTVTLLAPIVVAEGETLEIDLKGATIVYNSTTQGEAMITNKGILTINDTVGGGVINYNYTGAADPSYRKGNYTISNAGTLTVNGGKITIANLSSHAKYPIDNNSTTGDAILVINGGHLYNYNTSAIRQFCNSTTYKNSVTINGGLIEGYSAIWVQNPGSATVNGSLTITGGEIRTTAKAYVNGTSAIKDVSSAIYFTVNGDGGAWSTDSFVTITGGIFNENVYLAVDAPATLNVTEASATFNGYLELPKVYVAEINGTKYETLAEALDAAQAGDTITLLVPIVVAEDETLDLDLGGAILAFSSDATEAMILNKGTLTLSNGTVAYTYTGVATTSFAANAISNLGTLTINGVNVSNTTTANGQIGYAIDNYGSLTIKSGKITATGSNYYDGIRMFCNSETVKVSVTVKGGEISSIWMQNPSDGNGGNNTKDVLGSLTISGGKVDNVWLEPSSNFEASITGGIIGKVAYNQTAAGRDLTGFISGGTFGQSVAEEYCATGYCCKTNDDGTFTVSAHAYTETVTDPTCTEKGYTTYTCVCGDTYTANETAALGHTWVDATFEAPKTCSVCGVTEGEALVAVAKIGEKKYATLQAALDEVKDGETILLLANITITKETAGYNDGINVDGIRYFGDKSFTVDFGGFTVTDDGCVNDYLVYVNNKGTKANEITFQNGTLTVSSSAWSAIAVNSSAATQKCVLNLTGMTVNMGNPGNWNNDIIRARKDATVNLNNGTVINSKGTSYGATALSGGVLNINDGAKIVHTNSGSTGGNFVYTAVSGNGTINIYEGAVIESDNYAIHNMTTGNTVINIYGGTITARVAAVHAATNGGANESCVVTITGGIFTGKIENYTDAAIFKISGGTFSTPVAEEYCAEGYIPTANNDGTYGVTLSKFVAQIGDKKYATLAAAIAAAQAGDTITLLADITIDGNITIEADDSVTLDLAGCKLTAANLNVSGTLTINDTVGDGDYTGNVVALNGGSVTISGGTYTGNLVVDNGTIVANGGVFGYALDSSFIASGYTLGYNTTSDTYAVVKNYAQFLGAALRIDAAVSTWTATKVSLRFGYGFRSGFDFENDKWGWSIKIGSTTISRNGTEYDSTKRISNVVLTGIGMPSLETELYVRLYYIVVVDGVEYTVWEEGKDWAGTDYDGYQMRTVLAVATAIANDSSESEVARVYANNLITLYNANNVVVPTASTFDSKKGKKESFVA